MNIPAPHKEVILAALNNYLGDDLYRARAAFRGMNRAQMGEQHGLSGKTRQQILDDYQSHHNKVADAISYIKEQA